MRESRTDASLFFKNSVLYTVSLLLHFIRITEIHSRRVINKEINSID